MLEVKNVYKSYKGKEVLKGVNFNVSEGEIKGFIGVNGAGKTTLIEIICGVKKLDSGDIQGIPDLLILYEDKWATLENKRHAKATKQPNQEYYVNKMNNMSFSRFICPENKEDVLQELEHRFKG